MKRFPGSDKYHEKMENTSSRENRPLRYIPPYRELTDQSTSSAQRPSNYGEEVAKRLGNWLFYGQFDSSGQGSYEHESEYIEPNPEHSYDTHHHGRTDYDIPSSSSYDLAANLSNVTQHKRAEQEASFSANQNEKKFAEKKVVDSGKRQMLGEPSGAREHGDGDKKGEAIDNKQEHIYDNNQIKGEIAKTKLYLERWKNKKDDIYWLAHGILKNTDTDQITDKNRNGLLETLSQINKKLEEPLVKQEQEIAKEHISWVKTFIKRFNMREDWVQAGIEQQLEQLGMKLEDFYNSYQQLNELSKDSLLESYEKFVVANTKCEFIRESLKNGIPVGGIPKDICGRKMTDVNGQGYNCLIRALIKGANPGWGHDLIEAGVDDMRAILEEDNLVKEGDMLDLGSDVGKQLIDNMKTANLIEPDREILVYQRREGKIQCFSIIDGASDKPPYAVLREHDGEHFRAIEVPE